MRAISASFRSNRLYYGWSLVAALAVTELVSWGVQYYAFAVFLRPMEIDLGWSRAEMTGAFSLALLVSGIVAWPMGRWLDRHGPRVLMTAGSAAAATLVLAWSRVESLLVFYLIWAGIGATMAATFYEPAFVTVANWFARYRGRALTLLTFGGGFASVIFIPLSDRLITDYGWRTALVVLACILGAITIPVHGLLLRRHPRDMGLLPDGEPANVTIPVDRIELEPSVSLQSAVRGSTFRWLTGAFVLIMFANVALLVHLIPFLTDEGFDERFAAYATGFIGLMALPGRLFFTPLGSRIPRQLVTALIFGLQAIAILVLILAESEAGVWLFVILFGAGFGAITPARAALIVETYGPAEYGSISGVVALFITLARAAGPIGASLLFNLGDGYQLVMWCLFAASAAAAVAILFAGDARQADRS